MHPRHLQSSFGSIRSVFCCRRTVAFTVAANAATAHCPPLLPTARRQQVARHVVPPASKGGPIMNAVELTNCAMLLYELKPPPLLAILPQQCLVLIDVKGYIVSVGILPSLLLWNRYCLQSLHWSVWHSQCSTACNVHCVQVPSAITSNGLVCCLTAPHPLAISLACAFIVWCWESIANLRCITPRLACSK